MTGEDITPVGGAVSTSDGESSSDGASPLLDVRDLRVEFATDDGVVRSVRGISFIVKPGQTVAIVGESGSGKSVSMQAITGLLHGADVQGQAWFGDTRCDTGPDLGRRATTGSRDPGPAGSAGVDLVAARRGTLRRLLGARIGMIFQDPLTSLHPAHRIGDQITETIRTHERVTRREARDRAVDALTAVGISNARQRLRDHPHQFSGGMRQRIMIAIALACSPSLLIADEPTTALDVTVQAQVLHVIRTLQAEREAALLLITHDVGVVAQMADVVIVMYAGRIVEQATVHDLFRAPAHPYTQGLLASLPSRGTRGSPLVPIAGSPPSALAADTGCSFVQRCPHALDICHHSRPILQHVDGASSIPAEPDSGPVTPAAGQEPHVAACWLHHPSGLPTSTPHRTVDAIATQLSERRP
jgi:peptide/nickel transport system ATP-binding protein